MTDKITFNVGGERHELPIDGSKTLRVGSVSPSIKLTVERSMTTEEKAQALVDKVRSEYPLVADFHVTSIALMRTIEQHDALREALADLLHAVCGKTGFAETVRRDSGRIYPWPALDLAEAKALEALERSK